jgi:hypothetical protein
MDGYIHPSIHPQTDARSLTPERGSHSGYVPWLPQCRAPYRQVLQQLRAFPLAAGAQQIITSHIGNRNISNGIGNTLQNNQIHIYEKLSGEPVATIDRTNQKQLKSFGIPIRSTYLIVAGTLSMLANIAEINSGFFTGNFEPRINIDVGIGIMGLGAFLFAAGVRLYRNRFVSLIGPYGLQPGKDRSVHWEDIRSLPDLLGRIDSP